MSRVSSEKEDNDFNGDNDSLTEILARLPEKSVIRFQLVCKSWLSIISSDYFHRLHQLWKPPPSLILTRLSLCNKIIEISELCYCSNQGGYIKTSNEKQRIIPSNVCFDGTVNVLSCYNGLLILRNMFGHYYVFNPITNYSKLILFHSRYRELVHLVFDPLKSPHRYMIVCFRQDGRQDRIRAFDSESGKWSECVEGFTTSGVFYLIHRGFLYCFNILSQFIVCPLPKLADQGLVYHYVLQESNGCLYYCAFVGNVSFKPSATLWELKLNGEGDPRCAEWVLKYHHSVPPFPVLCTCMVVFISKTSTVLIRVGAKIMAYSFRDQSYKEFLPHFELFTRIHCCYVHVNRLGETLP